MKKTILLFLVALVMMLGVVSAAPGDVFITPSNPDTNDDITAKVQGYEGLSFDWFWYKDNILYYANTGTSSTLDSSFTSPGDTWRVEATAPASYWFPNGFQDSLTFTIQEDNGNGNGEAPVVTNVWLTIDEGEVAKFEYTFTQDVGTWLWLLFFNPFQPDESFILDVDTPEEDLEFTFYPPFNNNGEWQTEDGNDGEYKISFKVTDPEGNSDKGIIFLTVLDTINEGQGSNTCPYIQANDITVEEGDTAFADVIYGDDDGDALVLSFDQFFDQNGEWQNAGPVGVYTVIATVEDGQCDWSDTFTVTVLEQPCEDLNNNGICDDEEQTCEDLNNNGICDEEEANTCPYIRAKDIVVEEGDDAIADVQYGDDDGDYLTVTYDQYFDNNGVWENAGPVGVYTITVTVSDGQCSWSDTFTVTVLEQQCEDLNNNGICDEEEQTCEDLNNNGICDEDEQTCKDINNNGICDEDEQICKDVNLNRICDEDEQICKDVNLNRICDEDEKCEDLNLNGICDDEEEEELRSNYEGSKLYVREVVVLNANDLYSPYDVSDLNIVTSGSYYVEDDYLYTTVEDNEIVVYIELYNKNSFDARDLQLTFYFNGEKYHEQFPDLERGEKHSATFHIPIENDMETGKYGLTVTIENDDIYNEETLNLQLVSAGDFIQDEVIVQENPVEKLTFWEEIVAFFNSLF